MAVCPSWWPRQKCARHGYRCGGLVGDAASRAQCNKARDAPVTARGLACELCLRLRARERATACACVESALSAGRARERRGSHTFCRWTRRARGLMNLGRGSSRIGNRQSSHGAPSIRSVGPRRSSRSPRSGHAAAQHLRDRYSRIHRLRRTQASATGGCGRCRRSQRCCRCPCQRTWRATTTRATRAAHPAPPRPSCWLPRRHSSLAVGDESPRPQRCTGSAGRTSPRTQHSPLPPPPPPPRPPAPRL